MAKESKVDCLMSNRTGVLDVAVIGAGMAGLTCAQQLSQAGYQVVVVEKSRGVGGRVATRRLQGTYADHGTCYLKPQGQLLPQLIERLSARGILQVWTDTVYEQQTPEKEQLIETKRYPRYVAPTGMTVIAKFLTTGLDIQLSQRVQKITPTAEKTWQLIFDPGGKTSALQTVSGLTAKAVVVAIPAPQALMLLEPLGNTLSTDFLDNLRSAEFNPCLSVIAGYSAERFRDLDKFEPAWKACTLQDTDLAWIGLDSSKRQNAQQPVFVLQSTAELAQHYLDTEDLTSAAYQLLSRGAQRLIPWLDAPEWFQIHRWRYAFPKSPLSQNCLNATTPQPLVCCGDWCGGNLVEGAMQSGLAAAVQINQQLRQLSLPGESFWNAL